MIKFILYSLLLTKVIIDGANILAVFPTPLGSHIRGFTVYFLELAKKGHNVTVYTPFPVNDTPPNYNQIVLDNQFAKHIVFDDYFYNDWTYLTYYPDLWRFGLRMTEYALQLPEIQSLINSTDLKFDLILVEGFVQEAFYGLRHKFNAPLIQLLPFSAIPSINFFNGNPILCSSIPDSRTGFPLKMTTAQRIKNCLSALMDIVGSYWYYLPKQQELIDKYFKYEKSDNSKPDLLQIVGDVSLSLVHSDKVLFHPRPNVPSFIEVSDYHINIPKKLPQDLQNLMTDSKDGVVYLSFGSWLTSSFLTPDKQQYLLESLSKLPQTILWRGDANSLNNNSKLPKNIVIRKWFPQVDILAHPNTKLFITHGGIHSLMETVRFGVPVLGIPFFSDQITNILYSVEKGYGLFVDRNDFTSQSLSDKLNDLLNNPKYRDNLREISATYKDRPMSSLDTAVYWTEYVLRHKGAPLLKSPGSNLPWYQFYLLDVLATIFFVLFLIIFIIKAVLKKLIKNINIPIAKVKKI